MTKHRRQKEGTQNTVFFCWIQIIQQNNAKYATTKQRTQNFIYSSRRQEKKSSGKNARLIDDIVISDVSSSAAKRNHAFNNSVSIANPFFSSAYHFQRVFFKCPSCN
mmetsp:Transcript_37427/g.48159  ORF Transcript_37427/g.48159 Transcript_37427/m.48159 type:complete len:107 (+) Transcript_37427:246-566(+)